MLFTHIPLRLIIVGGASRRDQPVPLGPPHAPHHLRHFLPRGVGQHHLHPRLRTCPHHGQDGDGCPVQLLGAALAGLTHVASNATLAGLFFSD